MAELWSRSPPVLPNAKRDEPHDQAIVRPRSEQNQELLRALPQREESGKPREPFPSSHARTFISALAR